MNSRFARLITLVFAAIQFAAPAVASVGEGVFSNRVVDSRAHIEDRAQSDCKPPHSADCVVCRYLVDNVGTVAAAPALAAIVVAQPEPVASAHHVAAAELHGFEARGPPVIAG